MKIKTTLFTLLAVTVVISLNAQVLTANIKDTIPCCGGGIYPHMTIADSLDVNHDGKYDFMIFSNTFIDAEGFAVMPMDTPSTKTGSLELYDSTFSFKYYMLSGYSFISASMGCMWVGWLPGTGYRYIGFYMVNAPSDTNFGWIKLNFTGPGGGSCSDTVYIVEYAYDTVPNSHLKAGLTSPTSIQELFFNNAVNVYPNPTIGRVRIHNESSEALTISITDLKGELCNESVAERERDTQVDLSYLPDGIYMISLNGISCRHTYRIIKNGIK